MENSFYKNINSIKTALLRLLVPVKCMACGEITLDKAPFCRNCIKKFVSLVSAPCPSCGLDRDNCVCGGRKKTAFVFYYDSKLSKRIVAYIKHKASVFDAEYFASLLIPRLPEHARIDAVVYPPRGKLNMYRYGFDQAALYAGAIASRLGVPCIKAICRAKETKQQKLLSASQRRRNIIGAFSVNKEALKGVRGVLLFDDVMTTGATLAECTRKLHEAGIKNVSTAVIARTPRAHRTVISRRKYSS